MDKIILKEYIAPEAECTICTRHLQGEDIMHVDDWGRVYCEECAKCNELA